jgi:hypothetical protein
MGDLTNSTRTLHKATYVPIQATDRESRLLRQAPGRGFLKLNLLRALDATPDELAALRPATSDPSASGLSDVIDGLIHAVEASKTGALSGAQALAGVDADSLAVVADHLIARRRKTAAVLNATLDTIRRRIGAKAACSTRSLTKLIGPTTTSDSVADLSTAAQYPEVAGITSSPVTRSAADRAYEALTPHALATAVPADTLDPSTLPLTDPLNWAQENEPRLLEPISSSLLVRDLPSAPITFSARKLSVSAFDDAAIAALAEAVDGFRQALRVEPIGRLHLERMEMYPVSIERGELVYTVPLAPQETVTISHKEWSASSEEFENIIADYFEGYSEKGVAEKNDASMASESESKHSNSFNFGASVSGGYVGVTVSTSLALASTSDDRESLRRSTQSSREVTEKASARTRKEHKVTFKLDAKRGAADETYRVITNPSPNTSMRVDYFRLMRKWRTDLYRYGLRMTYDIVIPNPGVALWARYEELQELERQINEPLQFNVSVSDITETTWQTLASQHRASVEPPPPATIGLSQFRELRESSGGLTSIEFVAPGGYSLGSEVACVGSYVLLAGQSTVGLSFSGQGTIQATSNGSVSGAGQFRAKISGGLTGGERSALFVAYAGNQIIGLNAHCAANRLQSTFDAWRTRTLQALQDGALQAYLARIQKFRDRYAELTEQLGKFDALTLRRMEREEIIRGTLQWLFGPQFSLTPPAVQTIIDSILPGFEQSFTQLLETGAFSTLPGNHPYMTIASEIAAFSRTNYPGIPPANSEKNSRPLLFPQQRATWDNMQKVVGLLEAFRSNSGHYPVSLSELPGAPFHDFWGKDLVYRMPGTSGEYDLVSFGADGKEGGIELDADISSTADASLVARWFDYTPTSGIDIQLNSAFAAVA